MLAVIDGSPQNKLTMAHFGKRQQSFLTFMIPQRSITFIVSYLLAYVYFKIKSYLNFICSCYSGGICLL